MIAASVFAGGTPGIVEALVLLLVVAGVVALVTRRIGMPYTIGLVVVGVAAGLVVRLGAVSLSTDLVFYVFLPLLLFEAGFNLEARRLAQDWRRVLVLAVPGVLVAFALTAVGVRYLGGVTWAVAALFGALIAATDPVSVVTLFRRLGVPERLTTMIDAESLFNDGTAAVLFAVVLGAVETGQVSVPGAVGKFLWISLGGLVVGVAVGYAASYLHRFIDDHLLEITLSVIVAYGSFLLAQRLHMSGVVACVTAALIVGNFGLHRGMSPVTRVTMRTVWEWAAFAASSVIFLLVGLSIDLRLVTGHIGLAAIAFGVVLGARAVTIYGYGALARLAHRPLPLRWQHVLVWGGLRGTIALALVLSVPAAITGSEGLRVITFGVVLASLLLQGLTMPWFVRRLGLAGAAGEDTAHARRQTLLGGFVRAHEELARLQDAGELPRPVAEDLELSVAEHEAVLLEGMTPESDEPPEGACDLLAARIGALVAQRTRIQALRHAGMLEAGVADELVSEIDHRVGLLGDRLSCELPGRPADKDANPGGDG